MEKKELTLQPIDPPHYAKEGTLSYQVADEGYESYELHCTSRGWDVGKSHGPNKGIAALAHSLDGEAEAVVFVLLHHSHTRELEELQELAAQHFLDTCAQYGIKPSVTLQGRRI